MNMLRLFANFKLKFTSLPPSKEDLQNNKDQIARKLVGRYARGNIRLQQGKFVTDKDLKKIRKAA